MISIRVIEEIGKLQREMESLVRHTESVVSEVARQELEKYLDEKGTSCLDIDFLFQMRMVNGKKYKPVKSISKKNGNLFISFEDKSRFRIQDISAEDSVQLLKTIEMYDRCYKKTYRVWVTKTCDEFIENKVEFFSTFEEAETFFNKKVKETRENYPNLPEEVIDHGKTRSFSIEQTGVGEVSVYIELGSYFEPVK